MVTATVTHPPAGIGGNVQPAAQALPVPRSKPTGMDVGPEAAMGSPPRYGEAPVFRTITENRPCPPATGLMVVVRSLATSFGAPATFSGLTAIVRPPASVASRVSESPANSRDTVTCSATLLSVPTGQEASWSPHATRTAGSGEVTVTDPGRAPSTT